MSSINDKLTIKSVTIKNRLGMSPMCMYSSVDGYANNWHLIHYGTRATGGVGIIMQEATAVSPEGRITPHDLGLWKTDHTTNLREITSFISKQGAIPAIQLAHAGRKASHDHPVNGGKQLNIDEGGWETIAPSSIPFSPDEITPREMTINDIKSLINKFAVAAKSSFDIGYKIVEIHAAHGYLIHEFLSPLSNLRTDVYGGSFENRIRFLLEIVDAIKFVWPNDLPLFVRLSATDWAEGGWDIDECVMLAEILKDKGVDLIDCSSGGNIYNQRIELGPMYQVKFAEAIRKTGILTSAVGLITKKEEIEDILKNDKADLVFLGRELLRNPYFALKETDTNWPDQYLRSKHKI